MVGGHTGAAYRRAVGRGQGWYGFAQTPEGTAASLEGLRAAAARVERPAGLGALEITVTPRGRLTPEMAGAFAELGVDRLVVMPGRTMDDVAATIDAAGEAVAGL